MVVPELERTIPLEVISASALREAGAELTTGEMLGAIQSAWKDIRAGSALGGKGVLSLPEDLFWNASGFGALRQEFSAERLGWKLSALYSVGSQYAGVKIIGANAFNRRFGLPRSTSTYILMDRLSLRPIAIFDATAISAARTGSYAAIVQQAFLPGPDRFSVFIFGAGPVARSVIETLDHVAGGLIERIFIRSRTVDTSIRLVQSLEGQVRAKLVAVEDNTELAACAFVVTASNAAAPVFRDQELHPAAVTLHLGGDEVPEPYLQRVLRSGTLVCDDLMTVARRNSQSLSLYFSRRGLALDAIGPLLGIRELSASEDWKAMPGEPVCVTCVGLPMLDLYAVQATYEKYLGLCGESDEVFRGAGGPGD